MRHAVAAVQEMLRKLTAAKRTRQHGIRQRRISRSAAPPAARRDGHAARARARTSSRRARRTDIRVAASAGLIAPVLVVPEPEIRPLADERLEEIPAALRHFLVTRARRKRSGGCAVTVQVPSGWGTFVTGTIGTPVRACSSACRNVTCIFMPNASMTSPGWSSRNARSTSSPAPPPRRTARSSRSIDWCWPTIRLPECSRARAEHRVERRVLEVQRDHRRGQPDESARQADPFVAAEVQGEINDAAVLGVGGVDVVEILQP